jgi:hypothetical protein
MTLPDTSFSKNGLIANSQTNLLNWHLFKGGLRIPEELKDVTLTPETTISTFFEHYDAECKEWKHELTETIMEYFDPNESEIEEVEQAASTEAQNQDML